MVIDINYVIAGITIIGFWFSGIAIAFKMGTKVDRLSSSIEQLADALKDHENRLRMLEGRHAEAGEQF